MLNCNGIEATCEDDRKALKVMERRLNKLCKKLETMVTRQWTYNKKIRYLLKKNECMGVAYDEAEHLMTKYNIDVDSKSLECFINEKLRELRKPEADSTGRPDVYVGGN